VLAAPPLVTRSVPVRRECRHNSFFCFTARRSSCAQAVPSCEVRGHLSPMDDRMHFDARSRTHDPRMRVRVNVIGAIHPNAAPRRAIEIDGVRAPHKIGMRPSEREKSPGDNYGRPPTDRCTYKKSRSGRTKHHQRVVIGDVDVRWKATGDSRHFIKFISSDASC
jgi:hypothetical protein